MGELTPLVEQAARAFKTRAKAVGGDRIRELRIFGSRARGDWHQGSDLDILVLVDRRDPVLDRAIIEAGCSVEEELGFAFLVSPRIMSCQQFESLLAHERRLARDIQEEGVPL